MKDPYKILIVDDEPMISRALEAVLNNKGFEITKASSGKEALQGIADQSPNLVLLDIEMPEMNGLETCEKIREIKNREELAIIMITGDTDESTTRAALEKGANDFIPKPCTTEELVSKINKQRDRSQLG